MEILQIIILVCPLSFVLSTEESCKKLIYHSNLLTLTENGLKILDVLAIWSPVHAGSHNVSHLCSIQKGQTIEGQCYNNPDAAETIWNFVDGREGFIDCSLIDNKCKEESFVHHYLRDTTLIENYTNSWPTAKPGELVKSKESCFLEDGQPLTRKCNYNAKHSVAEWEKKDLRNIKCLHSDAGMPNMCMSDTGLPIEGRAALFDAMKTGNNLIGCNLVDNRCKEESFVHHYLRDTTLIENYTNSWPTAKPGELVKSKESCFLEEGQPLTRKCNYNAKHYVAEWEKKDLSNIKCLHSDAGMPNMCMRDTGLPIEGRATLFDAMKTGNNLIGCHLVDNRCKEESFVHHYLRDTTLIENYTNSWPTAKPGELVKSKESCFLEDGQPLTRKCSYNATHSVAEWEKKDLRNIKCLHSDAGMPNMCMRDTGLPIEGRAALFDAMKTGNNLIGCNLVDNRCKEESFVHHYLRDTTLIENYTNSWPTAKPGELVKSKESCFLEDGQPLTRKCNYNAKHYVAEWEKKDLSNIKCLHSDAGMPNMCMRGTGLPIEGRAALFDAMKTGNNLIGCHLVDNRCKEESFVHHYLRDTTLIENYTNSWPTAKPGELVKSKESCVLRNGLHLKRKCIYNAQDSIAEWDKQDYKHIKCLSAVAESPKMCSSHTGQPIEGQGSTWAIWDAIDKGVALIPCSDIADKCVEEPFEHKYVHGNGSVDETYTNIWSAAKAGEFAEPKERCLFSNGTSLTRKCSYNAKLKVSEWEMHDFRNIRCFRDLKADTAISVLHVLRMEAKEDNKLNLTRSKQILAKLNRALANNQLKNVGSDMEMAVETLNTIMQIREPQMATEVLETANRIFESSTSTETSMTLVDSIESFYDKVANNLVPTSKCANVSDGVEYYSESEISIFVINPACSNISGIAVYNTLAQQSASMHYDNTTNTYFRYIYLNQTEGAIEEPYLEAAAYIPQDLWKQLIKEAAGESNVGAVKITLYRNRNIFSDPKKNASTCGSLILKMSLPGYTDDLPGPVVLMFGHSHTAKEENLQCGSYEYRSSTWKATGVSDTRTRGVAVCKTVRLTSFSAILRLNNTPIEWFGGPMVLNINVGTPLQIISFVGCVLSLFGLICIWLTAICCKQWRKDSTNKLFLNVCFVLTLQMAYYLFLNMPDARKAVQELINSNFCIAEGAFIQYLILVLFLWMLILAILLYDRYIIVMGIHRSSRDVLIYMFLAWVLPIIPTGLVIYFDSDSYAPFSENDDAITTMCYLSGRSLFFSLLLPTSLISVVNICIYIYIMCSVRRSLAKIRNNMQRNNFKVQVRLSIMLFFILGISWVFGLLAHMFKSALLPLLFCLTSTYQGFILFIYFVVTDKTVRLAWLKCCCADAYKELEDVAIPLTSSSSKKSTL